MILTMDRHPRTLDGGWTVRRLEVIDDAAGICARCGIAGADTATHGWNGEDLVAAHTRCVVGLGPPPSMWAASRELLAA